MAERTGDEAVFRAFVLAELDRLSAAVDRLQQPRLSDDDRASLSRLVPAVAGCLGSRLFVVSELQHQAALRPVLGDINSKALGHLLRRGLGCTFGDLTIERCKRDGGRRTWCVRKVLANH